MAKFSRDKIQEDVLDWCQYHYKDNLAGLTLYDPRLIDADFPNGDINVLLVLKSAPLEARERYDTVAERLVRTLIPDALVTCRIQTVDEVQSLANLKLPLLEIYLSHADIFYDPTNILADAHSTLTN